MLQKFIMEFNDTIFQICYEDVKFNYVVAKELLKGLMTWRRQQEKLNADKDRSNHQDILTVGTDGKTVNGLHSLQN